MVMMDPREDIVMSGSQDNAHVAQNGFINPQDLHPDMAFAEPQPDPAAQSLSEELVQVDMPLTEEEKKAKARREANARRLLPTGCCYDARMKLHQNADFTFEPHHPEDPKRIQSIFNTFVDNGLVYVGNPKRLAEIMVVSPNKYMWRISARAATRPEICSIHTHEHFEWVESLVNMDGEKLKELSRSLDTGKTSLYVGHFTQQAALISCGGAIETCKNVVDGTLKNAIAIIRPPGHHAECANGMGFCFYNNVAVATRICQADYPNICRKVLILDWDVHHGNGTQNMFYDDPNVLYISIHVWKGGEMYPGWPEPGSGHSDATENSVGEGRGVGKNVNIPWITAGMGDGEYMAAFQRIVMPIAQEFGPDLVIISAGFDAAAGDELGGCFVSPACYSQMTHMLMSLAGGKVAVCLEGGYNLEAISNSALAVAQTLMGTPPEPLDLPPINTLALQVLNSVRRAHAEYWECMRPRKVDIPKDIEDGVLTLDVAIRRAQYTELREKHNMVELQMVHDNAEIVRIFKHQILMTPGLKSAKKIYLAAHDELGVIVDDDIGEEPMKAAKMKIVDANRTYIEWAIQNGFAVIDMNIPRERLPDGASEAQVQEAANRHRNRAREAICFVYDNYLDEHSTDNIILMGSGEAFAVVKELLVNRTKAIYKISGILGFITGAILSVTLGGLHADDSEELERAYFENSLLFVSSTHNSWTNPKIVKRIMRGGKWGNLRKSTRATVVEMMEAHKQDVLAWVKDQSFDETVEEPVHMSL